MSRIAFLFPGQGAQTLGMAQQLCETVPAARKLFDESSTILGYDLAQACWQGPSEKLNSTVISQPAIFVTSLAALEGMRHREAEILERCEATAGLSLGEYTALTFAGAFSFSDGLRLVQKRGEAMQAASEATPSAMVSVLGLELAQVEALCSQSRENRTLQVANLLCPGNIVVSGDVSACEVLEKKAAEAGARTIRLAVAGAFHTPIMKPADEKLRAALEKIDIRTPRMPVWTNVDGRPHSDPSEIRELLVRQVLEPVLWEQTLRNLLAERFETFYEIGPGRVLAGLLKRVNRKVECRNVSA